VFKAVCIQRLSDSRFSRIPSLRQAALSSLPPANQQSATPREGLPGWHQARATQKFVLEDRRQNAPVGKTPAEKNRPVDSGDREDAPISAWSSRQPRSPLMHSQTLESVGYDKKPAAAARMGHELKSEPGEYPSLQVYSCARPADW